jgi:hypothetical protein
MRSLKKLKPPLISSVFSPAAWQRARRSGTPGFNCRRWS